MNKLWPALTSAAVLLALPLPSAHAAEPPPTGVKVGWLDDTHKFVRVTWTEDGDLPNKVVLRHVGGATAFVPRFVPAGAPNVVDYPAADLAPIIGSAEIGVSVGTEAGETSAVSASAPFDTIDAGIAVNVSTTMSGGNTVNVRWEQYPRSEQDVTPNDPLDLTDSTTFTPQLVAGDKVAQLAPASKATQVTVSGRALPYEIDVVTSNEWGSFTRRVAGAAAGGLKAVVPTWVKSGSPTSQPAITGTTAAGDAPVYLQARNTATSPWYTVSSQRSFNGTFRFPLGASGSRQYRVFTPNYVEEPSRTAYFGSYSPTVATTVQVNPWSARFTTATVRRGQTATAEVRHSPTCNYAIVLQRWTGKTWSTVGFVRTQSGVGRGYVKSAAVGRVAYRYYLPAVTVNGYKYAAAYSANFVLTTI